MPRHGQVLKPLVKIGRTPDACWEWLGCKRADGLALKQIAGRQVTARRWIWEQLFGPIPAGYVIAQACGNNGCINPHHLRKATLASALRAGSSATLTPGDAAAIRAAREQAQKSKKPTLKELAETLASEYVVSPATIRDIWRGDTWKSNTKAPAARTPSIHLMGETA